MARLTAVEAIRLAAKMLRDSLVDAGVDGMPETTLFLAFETQGMTAGAWAQIVDAMIGIGQVRRSFGRLYACNDVGQEGEVVTSVHLGCGGVVEEGTCLACEAVA